MTVYTIALIGIGGVNRALAELIATKNQLWERDLGFHLNIVAVSDLFFGSSAWNAKGSSRDIRSSRAKVAATSMSRRR